MNTSPPGIALVRGRIALAAVVCVLAFSVVGARLIEIMVFGGADAGTAGTVASASQPQRADILDRNGALIARDLPIADLYASPKTFWNTQEAAQQLAKVTGVDAERLAKSFAPKRGYILVDRALTPDQQDAVMQLGLPGLQFEKGHKRYYPSGRVMAQAIGQTDTDGAGVSGLELGLDKTLRNPGQAPVELSLDMRVQYALNDEIGQAMQKFSAIGAAGAVLDVHTGEVLALVSLPDFEPNTRELSPSDSQRNRMTQDVYELGSIFKMFAFAEALEENTIRLDEVFDIGKPFAAGGYHISDFEKLGPTISASMIFAESSNIGTAQIISRSGPERQKAFLQKMGLLSPLKTEVPEMASPLIPSQWGAVESATISFGHGLSVNPLAFAAAAASIINGGTLIHPTFLKRNTPQNGARVISEATSDKIRSLLRLVVTDGTGKKADVPGYDVGGKTGTAEKSGVGGYSKKKQISSFSGVFPISNPRYLVFIMLDEPHATKDTYGFSTGGWTAAPAVGRVIARIGPMLDVPRTTTVASAEP
jgi:cell division protein FtsI (penicillin-binding protein 3)